MASTKVPIELSSTPGIVDNSNATAITIDSSENVGIGTSSIDQHLHVEGSGTQAIKVETTADDYAIMQYKTSTSSLWQSFASPTNDYRIGINGVGDALTINSSFNVGIGTSSPSTKFEVSGGNAYFYNTASLGGIRIGYNSSNYWDIQRENVSSGRLLFSYGASEKLAFLPSGDVGIGTSSPVQKVDVVGNIRAANSGADTKVEIAAPSDSYSPYIAWNVVGIRNSGALGYPTGSDALVYRSGGYSMTTGTERVRFHNAGGFSVSNSGTVSTFYNGASTGFGYDSGLYCGIVRSGTNTPLYVSTTGTGVGGFIEFYQATTVRGNITFNGSSTLYNATSDYRLKQNIVELPNALERVGQLNPVQFDWIESGISSEGFLAHEAQAVVPYSVTGQQDELYTEDNAAEEQLDLIGQPKYQTMDYGKLTPLLVKAIQEQQVLIEQLQAEVALLKGE